MLLSAEAWGLHETPHTSVFHVFLMDLKGPSSRREAEVLGPGGEVLPPFFSEKHIAANPMNSNDSRNLLKLLF